ncbi:MAG TPA: FMN-binding glutamate synthase family protein, partial [Bacteroidia bacterium]|nr:FMN-binding glutamate synthase family protein [Bacteroidia bacterium]
MRALFIRICLVAALLTAIISFFWRDFLWSLCLTGPLAILGIADMLQTRHSIKRNYPVIGRMRYWAEWMRPKIYQYFIESDTDGTPFNRLNRSVIYQRAKKVNDTTPFGTQLNVYEVGYEWLNHSITPLHHDKV